ncbi:Uncharacterised protein [Mycobacterium tuberculosis]|uniref:Uncharacterized protein n=2 Tax=Mycobacterium tuberculosis TaxID=1773 RepID=A0A654ZWF3_MYCTX|nr:Uncharacterised protein [Mycobacterium tuberculosis]
MGGFFGEKILPINSINVERVSSLIPTSPVSGLPLASTRNVVGRSPRRRSTSSSSIAAHAGVPLMKPSWNALTRSKADPCSSSFSASASITGSRVVMMPASTWSSPSAVLSVKRVDLPSATHHR